MNIKNFLKEKNNKKIVIILICIVLIIIGIYIYLKNNTLVFKNTEQIQEDLANINTDENTEQNPFIPNTNTNIDDSIYSNNVGVSNGTLYIKDNAEEKVKEAGRNEGIAFENKVVSENGLLQIKPTTGTNALEFKVLSKKDELLKIIAFSSSNLCDLSYSIGEVADPKMVEEGNDLLASIEVLPNREYTISNCLEIGTNIVFFFNKEGKFIDKTTENTFITPSDAYYIKVITVLDDANANNGVVIQYCLVLGNTKQMNFSFSKSELFIDKNSNTAYLPLKNDYMTIYVLGGEVELSYVQR